MEVLHVPILDLVVGKESGQGDQRVRGHETKEALQERVRSPVPVKTRLLRYHSRPSPRCSH
jgi:hypothetical protein